MNFAYGGLHPTDQFIMEHMLGLHWHTPTTDKEPAQRLRLSRRAVSQRAARIQQKLDARDEYGVF